MKSLKKLLVLVLFCLCFIPLFWFKPGFVIGGGDMGLPLDMNAYLKKGVWAWDSTINTGRDKVIGVTRLPEYLIFRVISLTGFSIDRVEIVYFSLILFGLLFSFYFFASQLVAKESPEEKTFVPFLGAVLYFFNFFSLTRWEGFDRPILYISIGVPLILGFFLKNLNKERVCNYLFLGIGSLLLSYAVVNPPTFLTGALAVVLFFLYLLFSSLWHKDYNAFKKIVFVGLKSVVVVILCNLFWVFPSLNLRGPQSLFKELSPIDWLGSISTNTSFKNVVRLMGAWNWYESPGGVPDAPYAQIYFNNFFFHFLTYLLPIFCFCGAALFFKKKKFRFLLVFLAVGLIFSMGEHKPFGKIYRFLYDNNIFFRTFRSPWFKFTFLTVLAYSFFYGFFSVKVIGWFKRFLPKPFLVLVFLFFFSLPVILSYPLIKAPFFEKWRVKIPSYVYGVSNYVNQSLKEGERLYFYTFDQNSNFNWGYLSPAPLFYHLSSQSILGPWYNTFPNDPSSGLLRSADLGLKSGGKEISNYLSYLGVKYLILRKDLLFLDKKEVDFIEEQIKKQKNIVFVKSFGSWDIYKNNNVFPLFSFKDGLVRVEDNETFLAIVGSGEFGDVFCFDCNFSAVRDRLQLGLADFKKEEKQLRIYEFEVKEKTEYFLKIKTAGVFNNLLFVHLDGKEIWLERQNNLAGLFIGRVTVEPGKHKLGLPLSCFSQENFIRNGNFLDKLLGWDYFEKGTYYGLPIKSSLEEFGTEKVKLQAINKSVVMSQKVVGLKKNKKYRLRFTFMNLEELPLQIGISTVQKEPQEYIINPQYYNNFSQKMVAKEIFFVSPSDEIFVNFYANVNSENPNRQVISNVSLQEAGGIESVDLSPIIDGKLINFHYFSPRPGNYTLSFVTEKAGWLTFNTTCNTGWEAYEKKSKMKHICVNGFANSYFISQAGNHQIEIYYRPQRVFETSLYISIGFLTILLIASLLRR